MKLIDFCVRYPVSVLVGVILLLLFGFISMLRIPVQMKPTVDRPEVSVETNYRGAAPAEIEREITDRIEEKLNSVEALSEITSSSIEGKSTVRLTFDWGSNKDIARLDVSEKLGLVRGLPDDADESLIRAVNTDQESPIAWIVLNRTKDRQGNVRALNEVRIEAEDVIKPRFERVPGVGGVLMFGARSGRSRCSSTPSPSARGT